MAEIIKINQGVINGLERVLRMAQEGRLTCFVLAGKTPDGEIVTCWVNAMPVLRQELISHLQVDLIVHLVDQAQESE